MTEFSHAAYSELLLFIRGLGRSIVSFRDASTPGSFVILRHDVDFSLRYAVEMAHLDRQNDATATFFILLTAPYYNPLTDGSVQAIREISSLGHECGLALRLHRVRVAVTGAADSPCRGLGRRSRRRHRRAGSHDRAAQTRSLAHSPGVPESFVDAYSAPFFKEIAYISDSRMMFRVPDVREFFQENPKSQALIHPIWWRPRQFTRAEIFAGLRETI